MKTKEITNYTQYEADEGKLILLNHTVWGQAIDFPKKAGSTSVVEYTPTVGEPILADKDYEWVDALWDDITFGNEIILDTDWDIRAFVQKEVQDKETNEDKVELTDSL